MTEARPWWNWIGLAAAPAIWAIGTEAKYAWVGAACESGAWLATLGISPPPRPAR